MSALRDAISEMLVIAKERASTFDETLLSPDVFAKFQSAPQTEESKRTVVGDSHANEEESAVSPSQDETSPGLSEPKFSLSNSESLPASNEFEPRDFAGEESARPESFALEAPANPLPAVGSLLPEDVPVLPEEAYAPPDQQETPTSPEPPRVPPPIAIEAEPILPPDPPLTVEVTGEPIPAIPREDVRGVEFDIAVPESPLSLLFQPDEPNDSIQADHFSFSVPAEPPQGLEIEPPVGSPSADLAPEFSPVPVSPPLDADEFYPGEFTEETLQPVFDDSEMPQISRMEQFIGERIQRGFADIATRVVNHVDTALDDMAVMMDRRFQG